MDLRLLLRQIFLSDTQLFIFIQSQKRGRASVAVPSFPLSPVLTLGPLLRIHSLARRPLELARFTLYGDIFSLPRYLLYTGKFALTHEIYNKTVTYDEGAYAIIKKPKPELHTNSLRTDDIKGNCPDLDCRPRFLLSHLLRSDPPAPATPLS